MHQQQGGHLSLAPVPEDDETGAEHDETGVQHDANQAQHVPLQPVELPTEQRPTSSNLTLLAAVAGVAALLLAALAIAWPERGSSPAATADIPALERAVALLAVPGTERITFANSVRRLVLLVGVKGDAVVALNGLGAAPEGRAYQAWVTPPGPGKTVSAGLFGGHEPFAALTQRVGPGAQVSITLEDEGGAERPSRAPRLFALRPPAAPGS